MIKTEYSVMTGLVSWEFINDTPLIKQVGVDSPKVSRGKSPQEKAMWRQIHKITKKK